MRSVGVGDFGSDPARLLLAQSPEGLFEPAIAPRSNADAARELGRLRRSSTLCQCGRSSAISSDKSASVLTLLLADFLVMGHS